MLYTLGYRGGAHPVVQQLPIGNIPVLPDRLKRVLLDLHQQIPPRGMLPTVRFEDRMSGIAIFRQAARRFHSAWNENGRPQGAGIIRSLYAPATPAAGRRLGDPLSTLVVTGCQTISVRIIGGPIFIPKPYGCSNCRAWLISYSGAITAARAGRTIALLGTICRSPACTAISQTS
jgi:hypothetical protein